ncbi:hypothetical protein H5410_062482, partial [Solanum commersonii]
MGDRVCFFISSDKSFEINDISEGSFRWFLFKEFSSRFVSKIKIDEVILRWEGDLFRVYQNFNSYGRFLRVETLRGQRKSAIIIPEMDYNVGWSDLADKIIDLWVNESTRILRCCLVGTFNDPFGQRRVQIQRSSISGSRKVEDDASGEDNNGEWFWNGRRLSLEWWSPKSGTDNSKEELVANQRWIRAFGIPLHAWSEKSLKFIGDCYGGYIGANEDTKKRNHILWARICILAVAREPPHKIDLRVGSKIYEISIIADAFSKISIRVGPKNLRQPWAILKQRPNCGEDSDQVYVFENKRPIDSNLKSAKVPRVGPKILRQLWANLRQRPDCAKDLHHLYYSRRKKGNLHLNKKKEILKEWKAIRPAQAQSIVAETQNLSKRQSNAKLSQKPLLASLTQIDSLDEWEGDADDEAECMRPLFLLSLSPIHSIFSIGYSQDSGFSSLISSDTLSLPWSGDSLEEQVISHSTVIETSHWTKMVMTKACKAFGVNSVGFEHEILDMILRMEQKRKLQLQKSKGKEQQKKRSKEKGFYFSGVYGPHSTPERFDLWDELAVVRGIWDGCWVIGGDFN